ncbi:MAG: DUF72 domain-containing protein [Chloroflexi bacterium]|nr:DUF72 domain-containing protein [Chloroflexota bacterium]
MIRIGTSGYSYEDWKGEFYPAAMKKGEMLAYYSREFNTTELNFTYYAMPNIYTLAAMARKTPPGFLFAVKANQELTHTREADGSVFTTFIKGLSPLLEAGKFGCVLAQFPSSFRKNQESLDYLKLFRDKMMDLPVVVEFRHVGWIGEDTFDFLRRNKLGFCCVDEPKLPGLIPPVAVATSNVAYVRFHGRNAKKWWEHEEAWQRYDYSYSAEELEEWVPKIGELAKETETTYVFTNNHWQGQAVATARQLKMMLMTE